VQQNKDKISGKMPWSLFEFAHFIYYPTYGDRATQFINRILTGEGLIGWRVRETEDGSREFVEEVNQTKLSEDELEGETIKSPSALLYDKIDEGELQVSNPQKWLAYIIKTMNWSCLREQHSRLRYHENGDFPEPVVDSLPEFQGPVNL
jgi:hypothetical protein